MESPRHNDYFDPAPLVYLTLLKVLAVVGGLVGLFGLYILIFRSPKKTTKGFRCLIAYHIIVAVYFQLSLTVLSPARVYLPYMAVDFPGIYTALGMPSQIQLGLLLTSIVAAVSVTFPLFYYRMENMLPPDHWVNSLPLRLLLYLIIYLLVPLLPLILALFSVQDQTNVKNYLYSIYQIQFEGFWSPEVVSFRFDFSNFWAILFAAFFVVATLVALLLTFICSCVIYRTFVNRTGPISVKNTRHRRALLTALMSSMLVILVIIAVIIPSAGVLIMTHSYRADLLNVVILLGACAFPCALLTFYATFAPYRRLMINIFLGVLGKKREEKASNNIFSATNKRESMAVSVLRV